MIQAVTAAAWMAGNVGDARVMLWHCVAFTVWSGIHYTWRTISVLRDPGSREFRNRTSAETDNQLKTQP
jgi:hypothetical protein